MVIREWCVSDHEAEDDQNEDILFLPFVASSPSHLGHNPRKTRPQKDPQGKKNTEKGMPQTRRGHQRAKQTQEQKQDNW